MTDPTSFLSKPAKKKVCIVYYLSRASQIDQPHLIEAYLPSSQDTIRLKDFKTWLSRLRGKGLPSSFAWAYKRIYRNSYIWQDLSDNDLIQPLCKNEFVLIGSEIPDTLHEKCRCGMARRSGSLKGEGEGGGGGGGGREGVVARGRDEASEMAHVTRGVGSREAWCVLEGRSPPLPSEHGADVATQTGESKRSSTEETCLQSALPIIAIPPPCTFPLPAHTPSLPNPCTFPLPPHIPSPPSPCTSHLPAHTSGLSNPCTIHLPPHSSSLLNPCTIHLPPHTSSLSNPCTLHLPAHTSSLPSPCTLHLPAHPSPCTFHLPPHTPSPPSPCTLHLPAHTPSLPSPPSTASTPPIKPIASLDSPDSVASSNAFKLSSASTSRPRTKHPSAQVLKQLLSCGSVAMDIDESSVFSLRSRRVPPPLLAGAMARPPHRRCCKAWSPSSSLKDTSSVSGLSDDSVVLRNALISRAIANLAAKDMNEGSCGGHRRSLHVEYNGKRMADMSVGDSPRVSASDNFTPSWRERLWSPKKHLKHGGKIEKRHL